MEPNQSKNTGYKPIQIVLYFVLTFLISWSFMIPWARGDQGEVSLALPCAGYGPFLAAGFVIWISNRGTGLLHWLGRAFRLRIPVILYLAGAFFLPLLIGGLQYGLYRVLGGEPGFSTANPWNLYVANLAMISSCMVAMRNPAGEASHFPPCFSDFIPCWPPWSWVSSTPPGTCR